MVGGIRNLSPKIRYGILGNIYGLALYLAIAVIAGLSNVPNNLHNTEDKLGLVYSPILFEVALYKYAALIVLTLTFGLTVWKQKKLKPLLLIHYILSNVSVSIVLFPGALLILGVLTLLLAFALGYVSFWILAITGKL